VAITEIHGADSTAEDDEVVVVCIGGRPEARARVAELVCELGVVIMAPDVRWARSLLERAEEGHRIEPAAQEVVEVDGLRIDRSRHRARWQGRALLLTRQEFELLDCLARDPGRVWAYGVLYEEVCRSRYLGDPSSLHAAVKRLRLKLRHAGVSVTIAAVRGVGFSLEVAQRSPSQVRA
jgi:DNA-binding winged helix-turn-helix (wHTH) protein